MVAFAEIRSQLQHEMTQQLPEHLARLGWSLEQIRAHQTVGLRRLIAHAKAYSPFHRERLADVSADTFEMGDLARLPVMTKRQMMQRFDEVVTERRLTRPIVEAALAATKDEPQVMLDRYFAMATGGSSGERGVFVYDSDAIVQYYLALKRWGARAMPPGVSVRAAFVAAACPIHATALGAALTRGGQLPLEFTSIPATLPTSEIVARLNELQPHMLFGYPSMLHRLAAEAEAGRLRITLRGISCTSETLGSQQREAISGAFKAPITDTFGSTEGLVGISAPNDPVLAFNSDQCIIELVDEGNRPVPPGARSAKVLLTNLSNLTQPLIRYELNDCFVQQPFASEHGHFRARVEGRADELLRYGNVDVHPLTVRGVMVKTPAVLDYQVRQTATGIDVSVLSNETVDTAALAQKLREALAHAGLAGAEVFVRSVQTLERNADSGKLKRFIPMGNGAQRKAS